MADTPAANTGTTKLTPAQKAARTKQSRLTAKEIKFLKELASGKSATDAALAAYDTTSYGTAASIASENLKKPKLRDALEAAYDAVGLTPQAIADVLRDGMLAKKTFQGRNGLVESDFADHSVRVNAARTAAQLIGAGKDPGDANDKTTINFNNFGSQAYIKNAEVKP